MIFISVETVVTVVVAEVGDVITAVPDGPTNVHAPVPTLGTAAIVNVLVLHKV